MQVEIQFVRDYPGYAPGAVTDAIPAGVADTLVRRGIAEYVTEAGGETDTPPPGPPKPKRGRPRKVQP